ncbi:MAG: DUF4157 domain-containing protein [Myxococcaceae bacterium]|nr:DUF4157 domain-containing protein [Myxococcaceae bacterium]
MFRQEAPPEQDAGRGGGEPLAGPTRARIESRLNTRVGEDVRIHRGEPAERAAALVGAPAFTVGRDIFLGPEVRPATPQGEHVLAHEVAHAVQQSGAATPTPGPLPRTTPGGAEERQAEAAARGLERPVPGAPLALAAAPPSASALPFTPAKTFKELWPQFTKARLGPNAAEATALAKELTTAPYDFNDILNHGIEVVDWLQRNGEPAAAGRMLHAVQSVWMIQFVSRDKTLPARTLGFGISDNDPRALISLGKDAARAGKHDQAFQLFGVANELLSYYALQATEKRVKKLDEEAQEAEEARKDPAKQAIQSASEFPRMIARSGQYSDLRDIYDQMRELYGFYSVLEREALDAGDTKGASDARTKAKELHQHIKDKHTWGDTQLPGPLSQPEEVREAVEVAEVSYVDTPKGPGLRLHGANYAETDLTRLPGLPSPKDIGNNIQVQNLGAVQSALMAQTDFQAEIGREPEIRKAFGDEPLDLNDTQKRQKVWSIMYGVYKKSGSGALGALMALIGRYLKAFTLHTTYNVRDWGKNYLDSDMPTDLAGRAEKDCGVYALTVAWDVFETVKHGDAKLEVSFDLTTMLEHVTLVITDKSTGEYYVVNNDYVSPPQKGDPLEQVAPQYAAIRGLRHTVGPAVTMSLGSTKDSGKKFHDDAWTRYLAAVDWGLSLDIPPEVQKLQKTDPAAYSEKVGAIHKARYEKFYEDQAIFDKGARALDGLVDGLSPVAGDPAKFEPALASVANKAVPLAALFVQLGPAVGVNAGSAKSQALLPKTAQYLFTIAPGHHVHPLARVARAILHLQALGKTATPEEDALLKFCQKVPQFKQQLDEYQKAGAQGPF